MERTGYEKGYYGKKRGSLMGKRERRDELLLLIAISGEMPADWIGRAAGSESYGAALLTRLKREGYIKPRIRDGLRGYLLREKGKRYLWRRTGRMWKHFDWGSVYQSCKERAG